MRKKFISVLAKLSLIAFIAVLSLALFLNLSTLWAVSKIQRGELVTSGYYCAIISSGSMEPTVAVDDLLIIKGRDSYQVRDIITYISPQGRLVTHRIKEVLDHSYITQGDANNIPDEEISSQRVLGRVVFILPGAGSIIDAILSPAGIVIFGCICLLLWLIQRIRRDQDEDEQDQSKDSSKS